MIRGLAHEKIPAPHRVVVVPALLRRRQHEEESKLGHGDGVGIPDCGDGDLHRRRRFQVDVVAADSVPRDDLEPGRCPERLGAERQVAQDEAVSVRDFPAEPLFVVALHLADVQVGAACKNIESCLIDCIVYDYFRHGGSAACGRTRRPAERTGTR